MSLLLLLCMLLLLLDLRLLFACCTRLGEFVRCAASLERVTRVATPTAVVVFVDVVIATVVVVVATVAGFLATISLILPLLLLLLLSPLPVAPPGSSLRTDCRVPVAGEARLLVSFSLGLNGSAVSAGAILVRRYCQTYPGCITGTRGPLSD